MSHSVCLLRSKRGKGLSQPAQLKRATVTGLKADQRSKESSPLVPFSSRSPNTTGWRIGNCPLSMAPFWHAFSESAGPFSELGAGSGGSCGHRAHPESQEENQSALGPSLLSSSCPHRGQGFQRLNYKCFHAFNGLSLTPRTSFYINFLGMPVINTAESSVRVCCPPPPTPLLVACSLLSEPHCCLKTLPQTQAK